MKELFTKLDLLSAQPTLFISSQPRYQSLFGFFVTVLDFAIILGFGLYFFISFINGDEVYLIYSKDTKIFDPKVNLTKRIFFYQVADYTGVLVDPRLVETVPTLWYIDSENTIVEVLEEEQCDLKKNIPGEEYENLINFDISNYKCVSRKGGEDLELSITHSPFSNTYMNLYITMCQNSTKNNNHCYPKETIEEKIKDLNIYLNFYLESTSLDHHNQKNPISATFYADQVSVSPDFVYAYFYDWRTLFYESDEGIVFPSIKTIESFSIDSTTKRNEIYPKGAEFWAPDSLSIFQFGMNAGYAEKYQRSYPKFQTFLANFGGIFNVLIKIGECVAYIASNHLMYSSVLCTLNNIKIKKKSINLNTSDSAINNKNDKNIMTTSQYNSITNILQKQPDIKLLTRGHTVKEKIIKVNSCDSILANLFPQRKSKKASFIRLVEKNFKEKLSVESIFQIFFALDITEQLSKEKTLSTLLKSDNDIRLKRNITDIQMAGVSKTNKIISLTGFGDINDYQKSVDVSGAGINKL